MAQVSIFPSQIRTMGAPRPATQPRLGGPDDRERRNYLIREWNSLPCSCRVKVLLSLRLKSILRYTFALS